MEIVSLTPRQWRSQPARPIQTPPASHGGERHQRHAISGDRRSAETSGMAIAAAAKPPSTSAPSPPIMIRPMRAGMAKARPVRISGAARCSVFWQEKAVPKPPCQTRSKNSSGRLAERQQEDREQRSPTTSSATSGIDDGFGERREAGRAVAGIANCRRAGARRSSSASRTVVALVRDGGSAGRAGGAAPPDSASRAQVIEPTRLRPGSSCRRAYGS